MKSRFQIYIEGIRFNATLFAKRPSTLNGEWELYERVENWIRANRSTLRTDFYKSAEETNAYLVKITDTMDGAVARGRVYIQPPAPTDADRFAYLGCFDSIEYFYAASLRGGKVWWKAKNNRDLAERRDAQGCGNTLITYSQTPPTHYLRWEGWKFEGVDGITAEVLEARGGNR
jgi:hypothetical protein